MLVIALTTSVLLLARIGVWAPTTRRRATGRAPGLIGAVPPAGPGRAQGGALGRQQGPRDLARRETRTGCEPTGARRLPQDSDRVRPQLRLPGRPRRGPGPMGALGRPGSPES
jgi:hypothetical protein